MGDNFSNNTDEIRKNSKKRFVAIDSFRGICAIFVTLFHFQTIGVIHNSKVVLHSYIFVDFFFVLSGFVIAASYGDRLASEISAQKFMLLRLFRIYPLHAAIIFLYIFMQIVGMLAAPSLANQPLFQGKTSLLEAFFGLLFIQIYFGTVETWYNSPSWSISAEIWAYLISSILFRFGKNNKIFYFSFISFLSFCFFVYFLHHNISDHHWGALPRCLFSFGIGVVSFYLYQNANNILIYRSHRTIFTIIELVFLIISVRMVNENYSLLSPIVFAIVVIVFAFEGGLLSDILLAPPMKILGKLSYSIYMTHSIIQGRILNALDIASRHHIIPIVVFKVKDVQVIGINAKISDLITLIMIIIVIFISFFTFNFIEKPSQKWLRTKIHYSV